MSIAAPRRHGRDGVGRGDADHVGVDRHAHIVLHGAGVVAVADRGDAHAGLAGALDRVAHGEGAADLAHAVVAVDHQGAGMVLDDARPAGRIDRALSSRRRSSARASRRANGCRAGPRAPDARSKARRRQRSSRCAGRCRRPRSIETRVRKPPLVLDPRILGHLAPRCFPRQTVGHRGRRGQPFADAESAGGAGDARRDRATIARNGNRQGRGVGHAQGSGVAPIRSTCRR